MKRCQDVFNRLYKRITAQGTYKKSIINPQKHEGGAWLARDISMMA
jgi:hypothetical protein